MCLRRKGEEGRDDLLITAQACAGEVRETPKNETEEDPKVNK